MPNDSQLGTRAERCCNVHNRKRFIYLPVVTSHDENSMAFFHRRIITGIGKHARLVSSSDRCLKNIWREDHEDVSPHGLIPSRSSDGGYDGAQYAYSRDCFTTAFWTEYRRQTRRPPVPAVVLIIIIYAISSGSYAIFRGRVNGPSAKTHE